ncbi:MAG: T9SS type B sorting domain-containing protein [Bacteroidales bacterium]|nr:T9SS type B sorting domain-containing protein [Bacteroidales bacterium]
MTTRLVFQSQFLFFLLYLSALPLTSFSQETFILPDSTCVNDTIQIINNSRTANSYYWNFCSGNLLYTPSGENINNQGNLDHPAFITVVESSEGYFSFITNQENGTITRNFFGQSLLNTPVSVNLGNFSNTIPVNVKGIQVINDSGNWYALIVGGIGDASRLVRLSFGGSLQNLPTSENLGNVGDLAYPIDLFVFFDGDSWIGITTNFAGNSITMFDFGYSLANTPLGSNLGNVGNINQPTGIYPVKENDQWIVFVSNMNSHSISRLSFGTSLKNLPSGENFGYSELLDSPYDITFVQNCDRIFGFVLNQNNNNIVRMDFVNGITSRPDYTSVGNIGELSQPQGISEVLRQNDTLLMFVANNGNNTLSRLYFTNCEESSILNSTARTPPPFSYSEPGNYNISLILDEGDPTQEEICKNIEIYGIPESVLRDDTVITSGQIMTLDPGEGYADYIWSTGETSQTIEVDLPGIYQVTITNAQGCTAVDAIEVLIELGIPNFFTPNDDGYNDRWEWSKLALYPNAVIQIFNRYGKLLITYNGSDPGWDGTYRGQPVPTDSYWYIIDLGDGSKVRTGHVTIIR